MANNPQRVAIVGAGVIGLYLAWQLSLKGHEVSVYEKKSEKYFGDKPCSTLVSERIKDFIPIEDDFIENKIIGCLINFPQKTVQLNFSSDPFSFIAAKIGPKTFRVGQMSQVRKFFLRKRLRGFRRVLIKLSAVTGACLVSAKH